MYAIVEIAGQQFKVRKDQQIYVHRLDAKEGDKIDFDNVLLIDDNGKVNVGAPAINGAQVSAKVLQHLKGDKVIVFKKKRRKGYKVKNGHRQLFTQVQIENIVASGGKKATSAKAEVKSEKPAEKPAAKKETETKKAAPKAAAAEKKEAPKKAAPKKTEEKKTAPKAAAKKPAAKKETKTDNKKSDDKKSDDKKES